MQRFLNTLLVRQYPLSRFSTTLYLIEFIFAGWNELEEFLYSIARVFIAESAVRQIMNLLAAFPDIAFRTMADLYSFDSLTAHTVNFGCLDFPAIHFGPLFSCLLAERLIIGSVGNECRALGTDDSTGSNYFLQDSPFH